MSQFLNWWAKFFLKAAPLRTYAETLALQVSLILLLILVYGSEVEAMMPTSLLFLVVPCCGLYYSARLRVPTGRWYRRFAVDGLWLLVPLLVFNVPLIVYVHQRLTATNDSQGLLIDAAFIGLFAFSYLFFRVGIRLLVWWNRLRQRRLIWSLVTSHLIAVALLQALIVLPAVALLVGGISSPRSEVPSPPVVQIFYRLQLALPLIGVSILGASAILLAILPVSIVVSYFFARRIKRRLDALLNAAHAAGDGNYDVRVPVTGQDEIAKLQTDFNAMAASLGVTVSELRSEREKVDALLKSRRELMASVSHELRTPIATVRAYLDSARRQNPDRGDVMLAESDLAIIEHETERLQTLIDDLFALSRAEVDQLALKCVPLDAVALIAQVVATVATPAWRINRVEVLAQTPARLPNVLADGTRLEQALRNLIHNSLRHTPPGGLVIVSAGITGGQMYIQVRDTGEGIAAADLPHIWERYYRGENGDTGIGLSLVKSFTEAMNGQIAVESTPDEGACFTITLPLSDSAAPSIQPDSMLVKIAN